MSPFEPLHNDGDPCPLELIISKGQSRRGAASDAGPPAGSNDRSSR
jgi:hypothetical protein